ncbi:N-6 DNA methylase [Nonomuraea sp. NPDC046570]|uniref:N-6 DNA methylase n=1 Tax=Nonomuraea sp. NPDC046570 TaxID=3155255 RepID=UPI0033D25A59
MHDSATVAAADIARLAGVGRAAVSNWRRRFDDFPAPVGGTSSSPLFSLADVEGWLRRQGKLSEVPLDERVWQQLRAGVEDLRLAEVLAEVGDFLLRTRAAGEGASIAGEQRVAAPVLRAVAELAEERGAAETFDFLFARYLEAHSRRVATLPAEAADLMTRLAAPDGGTVFDPACGLGTLLLSAVPAGAARLRGQERDEAAARIAAARLLLHGHDATVRAGDSLRADRFASAQADTVVCSPPYGERNWGYEELASDPRWQYGLPPRGEPELAWVQHCLAHVKPGGHAIVLMPSAAADRRSGRRVRVQLLRTGALRAVVALPAGTAPHALGSPHLWILRRPEAGDPTPTHVLMADVSERSWPDLTATVADRWRAFRASPAVEGAVPLIDLLDEEVDLTPARHTGTWPEGGAGVAFVTSFDAVEDSMARLQQALEGLRGFTADHLDRPRTTIAEQVRAGAIALHQAPRRQGAPGPHPVLTVDDVIAGRPPSGRASVTPDSVNLRPGDVVVPAGGRVFVARVVTRAGAVLGGGLHLFRVDPDRVDAACLAGFLRIAGIQAGGRSHSGTSRSDIRRVEIPRLPVEEQRSLGRAFQRLEGLEEVVGRLADQGAELVTTGYLGLGDGTLRPAGL